MVLIILKCVALTTREARYNSQYYTCYCIRSMICFTQPPHE